MFDNIITANLSRGKTYVTASRYMEDYGQVLKIEGMDLPSVYQVDFSNQSVQATQFVVDDTTADVSETSHDHFDVRLRTGLTAKGRLYITTPVSGKLMIHPVGDASSFIVNPDIADINPSLNAGRIDVDIRRNPAAEGDQSGKYITLSFTVEAGDREIDANSEILNGKVYRFIL